MKTFRLIILTLICASGILLSCAGGDGDTGLNDTDIDLSTTIDTDWTETEDGSTSGTTDDESASLVSRVATSPSGRPRRSPAGCH